MLGWLNVRCEDGLLVYTLGSSADGLRALEDLLSRETLDGAVTGRLLELLTHQSLRDPQAHAATLCNTIFSRVLNSQFLSTVWPGQLRLFQKRWVTNAIPVEKIVGNIINSSHLAQELLKRFDDVILPIELIESLIGHENYKSRIPDPVKNAFADLRAQYEEAQRRREEQFMSLKEKESDAADGEECDYGSFREVSVYPLTDEITSGSAPATPKNVIKGTYASVDHYLHTHFHLLRDDCMIPLRDGIRAYLGGEGQRDIRVYHDVKVVGIRSSEGGIAYTVQFGLKGSRSNIDWEKTKRLLTGSLLCISGDGFRTLLWATVEKRDPKALQQRKIEIRFPRGYEPDFKMEGTYVMAESSAAYFEAYRHVLLALQNIRDDALPFQRYLLRLSNEIRPPAFFDQESMLDFSLLKRGYVEPPPPEQLPAGRRFGRVDTLPARNPANSWPLLQPWPTFDSGLNASQLQAVRLALTNELALIQGPPGTGKTFVGLKIARLLLQARKRTAPPILCVCYTNHALDQFLEGIYKFEKNVVRIGGRSSSTILGERNIMKLQLPHGHRLLSARWNIRRSQDEVSHDIVQCLENLRKERLSFNDLHKVAFPHHLDSLCECPEEVDEAKLLDYWLELPKKKRRQKEKGKAKVNGAATAQTNRFQQLADLQEDVATTKKDKGKEKLGDESEDEGQEEDFVDEQLQEGAVSVINAPGGNEEEEEDDETEEEGDEEEIRQIEEERALLEGGEAGGKKEPQVQVVNFADLTEDEKMPSPALLETLNLWSLRYDDRARLHFFWLRQYKTELKEELIELCRRYEVLCQERKEIEAAVQLAKLEGQAVVGMTTTAAAKYQNLIRAMSPSIIIVEEAAEVLEAHVIATLTERTEHLILIGDHQQLRPQASVYRLATKHHLDVSLFERLINNGVPHVTLSVQHRMRPEISRLVAPIYPALTDADAVGQYAHVKGVSKDVFFVEHRVSEERERENSSKRNKHEAEFIVALCKYLVQQGYQREQITILTTYVGQLFELRALLRAREIEGVRVSSVDNYQGEENDIVLLSLVRSNADNTIGFLRSSNRVCVALSRAKMGFYCIGNAKLLQDNSPLWRRVMATLRDQGCAGASLSLACQKHPHTNIVVAKAADFTKAPMGGCMLKCDSRLPCGHACTLNCHPDDSLHEVVKCWSNCAKKRECQHACPLKCWQPCGDCRVRVRKTLPCGHTTSQPCYLAPELCVCDYPCTKGLPCGHNAVMPCHQAPELVVCKAKCKAVLPCRHQCPGTCSSCEQGNNHVACTKKCERTLVCGHPCDSPCVKDCPPCKRKCGNKCVHSTCNLKCQMPCIPCTEPCAWRCEHVTCPSLCGEPCDRPPCNEPCKLALLCGHPCIGLCGEPCPTWCFTCTPAEEETITLMNLRDFDKESDRFVQLIDCQHVFEVSGLDSWMNQQAQNPAIQLPHCPNCRTPIRQTYRYGNVVKQKLQDIEGVKRRLRERQKQLRRAVRETKTQASALIADLEGREREEELMREMHGLKKRLSRPLGEDELHVIQQQLNLLASYIRLRRNVGEKVKAPLIYTVRLDKLKRDMLTVHVELPGLLAMTRDFYLVTIEFLVEVVRQEQMGTDLLGRLDTLERELKANQQPTLADTERWRAAVDKLQQEGLSIGKKTLQLVIQAMAKEGGSGHWFKCPNGHLYFIGECGGAMQEGVCPDCHATVGGHSHRLRGDNAHAAIDGSSGPAWPQ